MIDMQMLINALIDDKPMNQEGHYPLFDYGSSRATAKKHGMTGHKHFRQIMKRLPAVYSLKPPFSFSAFKKSIYDIARAQKAEGYAPGRYEFRGSEKGHSPTTLFNGHCQRRRFTTLPVVMKGHECYPDCANDEHRIIQKSYCLVAYLKESHEIIGYLDFDVRIIADMTPKKVTLFKKYGFAWVQPRYRGLGYGADMGLVCGELFKEKYLALSRTLPSDWTLGARIEASHDSFGGQAIVQRAYRSLVRAHQELDWTCRHGTVDLEASRNITMLIGQESPRLKLGFRCDDLGDYLLRDGVEVELPRTRWAQGGESCGANG